MSHSSAYEFEVHRHAAELGHASTPGAAMTGLLKIVRWLSHRRRTRDISCKSGNNTVEKHVKGRFGLNPKLEDKETRKKIKELIKNTKNYQRHIHSGVHGSQSPTPVVSQKRYNDRSTSGSSSSSNSFRRLYRWSAVQGDSHMPSPRMSPVTREHSAYASAQESPVANSKCYASSFVDQNLPSYEIMHHTDKHEPHEKSCLQQQEDRNETHTLSSTSSTFRSVPPESTHWKTGKKCGFYGLENQLKQQTKTRNIRYGRPPNMTKAKTLSIESRELNNENLCATWPPAGKASTILEEDTDVEECAEEENENILARSYSQSGEETMKEWYIPFSDIEFKEKIRSGRNGDIYRGRWYGEVLIYTFKPSCDSELQQFLDDVAQMGMIRHENIVLFMGACIEPNNLAVITSMRKGPTLYEYLHLKRHRLPFHSKLNIARQIAQGMGYLHAKGIAHTRLNSKNIFLESRVKLGIMDHGIADKNKDRFDYACIPRGQLSYISPEHMRTLKIFPPKIFSSKPYTQESDIYAFGSLLFELLAEKFTFHNQHPHAIIWQVASGTLCSLHNFRFINGLKSLIRKCWSQNPQQRPPFLEIVTILQENVSHHKRHSSSEPDKLHYTGQTLFRKART